MKRVVEGKGRAGMSSSEGTVGRDGGSLRRNRMGGRAFMSTWPRGPYGSVLPPGHHWGQQLTQARHPPSPGSPTAPAHSHSSVPGRVPARQCHPLRLTQRRTPSRRSACGRARGAECARTYSRHVERAAWAVCRGKFGGAVVAGGKLRRAHRTRAHKNCGRSGREMNIPARCAQFQSDPDNIANPSKPDLLLRRMACYPANKIAVFQR